MSTLSQYLKYCRNQKGLKPIGQLVQKPISAGFKCVQDY